MLSIRNGVRALVKAVSPTPPASGQRGLYPRGDGWYDQQSDGSEVNLNPARFKTFAEFNAALARRESRRCKILWPGASIAEGYNSSSYLTQPARLLQAILRDRLPTSGDVGGLGYFSIPTQGLTPALASPMTIVGGTFDPTTVGAAEAFSIGTSRNCWYTNGTGTITFQCGPNATSLDVYHTLGTSGHAQGGQYKINGGAATQFNTFNATTIAGKVNIPVTPYASVEISRGTGVGYIIVGGIEENGGDESKGIVVGGAGHSGYYASIWASAPAAGGWRDHWLLYNPDLIILSDFGANDGSTGGQNKSPATFKSDLLNLISVIRAGGGVLATVPILIVADQDISAGITLNGGSWQAFVKAMNEIVSSDTTLGFLDMTRLMPPTSGNPKGLYAADLVHSASDGAAHRFLAQGVANAITFTPQEGRATAYSDDNPPKTLMLTEYTGTVPTPASGQAVLYSVDGSVLLVKDDSGTVRTVGGGQKISALTAATSLTGSDVQPIVNGGSTKKVSLDTQVAYFKQRTSLGNAAVADQTGFAADTYIVGSNIVIPAGGVAAKTTYKMRFNVVKTAAGVGTPVISFRVGTLGTTSDSITAQLTFDAQTAVIDEGWIECTFVFRTVGSGTSAVVQGVGQLQHQLITTGLNTVGVFRIKRNTSGGFNSTAITNLGCSLNAGGSAAWTLSLVDTELRNLP